MAGRFDAQADQLHFDGSIFNYNQAYTILGWFYISVDRNAAGSFLSVNAGSSTANLDTCGLDADGTTLRMSCHNGSTGLFLNGSGLSTGTWYHLALVRSSGSNLQVFLDGVSDISNSHSVIGRSTAASRLDIGGIAGSVRWLNGRAAYVRAWATNLSAAEIAAEMNSPTPVKAGAWAVWDIDAGAHTTDDSGNARTLTEAGTITDEDGPSLLGIDDAYSETVGESPAITGESVLTVADGYSATVGESPAITTGVVLLVDDAYSETAGTLVVIAYTAPEGYTVFAALLDLARVLDLFESTATGGTNASLIDSNLWQENGYFSGSAGGTLFLKATQTAHRIVNHTGNTLTFTPVSDQVVQSGDEYAASTNRFPLYVLKQALARALRSIGALPQTYASLTTVADQEEYTLPATVYNVQRVEILDPYAADYVATREYVVHHNWQEIGGKIRFDPGHIPWHAGDTIRLTYTPAPATTAEMDDTLSPFIHPDRLKWEAAIHCWRWLVESHEGGRPWQITYLNEALSNAAVERMRHPIPAAVRDPHYSTW